MLTRDEQLLKQGLEINDLLQFVLSKYDSISSDAPLAVEAPVRETVESPREAPAVTPSAPPFSEMADEEDEFAQLAQRYFLCSLLRKSFTSFYSMLTFDALCICRKNKSVASNNDASSSTGDLALVPVDAEVPESSSSVASNALVPLDPAPSSSTESKELDLIDLLSLTLCSPTPETSADSSTQGQNGSQQPAVTNGQQYPSGVPQYPSNYQPHATNQGYNNPQTSNYIVPWAQTGAYPPQHPAHASGYPAPPWGAPTPGTVNTNPFLSASYQEPRPHVDSTAQSATYAPAPSSYAPYSMSYAPPSTSQYQQSSSAGYPISNGPSMSQAQSNVNQQPKDSSAAASKPYYIPDNLFSDLIDLKGLGGGNKMGSSNGGQPMIGGKK